MGTEAGFLPLFWSNAALVAMALVPWLCITCLGRFAANCVRDPSLVVIRMRASCRRRMTYGLVRPRGVFLCNLCSATRAIARGELYKTCMLPSHAGTTQRKPKQPLSATGPSLDVTRFRAACRRCVMLVA